MGSRMRRGGLLVILVMFSFSGCTLIGANNSTPRFNQSLPRVLLLVPPVNRTPGFPTGENLLAWSVVILSEAGYYVLPPVLTSEVFARHGFKRQEQIRNIAPEKLRRIFGAEGVVYLTVDGTGTRHQVSGIRAGVHASGELVDLRSGRTRWKGRGDSEGGFTFSTLLPEPIQMMISSELWMTASQSMAGQAAVNLFLHGDTPLPPGPFRRD
ncbi:DUF799 family lipoprotein [Desulforhopalus vacuolatus]|uniref:GNA1162 family protein n=1 Tax=Desulforhopalus vacuolatus TaxID=40414 RepID=UPI001963FEEB|nr:GNA1162 family protein [Desulforhopalus vacuolatus]MBM9519152.1 DUF799 family lipoprotein [Desulforhopalus vacuolatus]